jgi:ribosome-associated protein
MISSKHKVTVKNLLPEISFIASRSSGPGGQNVNKVNTKMTLIFDVGNSQVLNDDQRKIITEKLVSRISKEGVLTLNAQSKRSQLQNKEVALNKFDKLLAQAFTIKKTRKPSKPKKSAILKRLDNKKQQSEKKKMRQKPD